MMNVTKNLMKYLFLLIRHKNKSLPDAPGRWELVYSGGRISKWEVYMRDGVPYATNENQTDPCSWLGGDSSIWRRDGLL